MRSWLVIVTGASNVVTRVILDGCYPSIGTAVVHLFVLLMRFSNVIRVGIVFFGQLYHITLIAGINSFYTRYVLMSHTLKGFIFLM